MLKLYYSIHNSIRICKRDVVAAYHVVWECVMEQWLGVRRIRRTPSAYLSCLKDNFKFFIKIDIKTAPKFFGVITIVRKRNYSIWLKLYLLK